MNDERLDQLIDAHLNGEMVVARNRKPDEPGTPGKESQPVQPLRLKVEARRYFCSASPRLIHVVSECWSTASP